MKKYINIKTRTYKYSLDMIKFLNSISSDQATKIITNQLIRSATSIGANIVESRGAISKKDFRRFLCHSLKSANESLYWLRLLRDTKHLSGIKINYLLQETKELSNILGASVLSLNNTS